MTRPLGYPLTVYYDASCPLCATEMNALLALDRLQRLELVDCSAADFDDTALLAAGVNREKLMTLMHARDAYGRWLVGPDCFEALYAAVGLHRISRAWGSKRLRPIWNRVYPWIARNRQTLSRLRLASIVAYVIPKRKSCDCNDSKSAAHR
jgi:predicted DCC family thiol-disulfide oxidoreductase YuxK